MAQLLIPMFPLINFAENPKLDGSEPRKKTLPKPCSAQYCMRATVKRYDLDGELVHHYHGYSQDMNISEETENMCDRKKMNGETCSPASLLFLKQTQDCNGRIMESDKHDNNPIRVF
jgi:hypothetical protein